MLAGNRRVYSEQKSDCLQSDHLYPMAHVDACLRKQVVNCLSNRDRKCPVHHLPDVLGCAPYAKGTRGKQEGSGSCGPWLERDALKAAQLKRRLACCIRICQVELGHVHGVRSTSVGDLDADVKAELPAAAQHCQLRIAERRVGKAVPKRVQRLGVVGVVPAVAHLLQGCEGGAVL